jgi:phage terminase large subunit-like protein
MTRIVTSRYRYKPPSRKRKPAAPLEGPRIVTIRDKKRAPAEKVVAEAEPGPATTAVPAESTTAIVSTGRKRAGAAAMPAPASTEDAKPAEPAKRSAIVTARRPGKRYVEVPEMTPEEHQRRGDLADAMMQKMKRAIAEKVRK